MSGATTRLVRPFAGADRAFDIGVIGTIQALERACNAGMGTILARLEGAMFYHADVRETIRLGLMGAGMPEPEATALVQDNVDGRPILHQVGLAVAIMTAYAVGVDDATKKAEGLAGTQPPDSPVTSAN